MSSKASPAGRRATLTPKRRPAHARGQKRALLRDAPQQWHLSQSPPLASGSARGYGAACEPEGVWPVPPWRQGLALPGLRLRPVIFLSSTLLSETFSFLGASLGDVLGLCHTWCSLKPASLLCLKALPPGAAAQRATAACAQFCAHEKWCTLQLA